MLKTDSCVAESTAIYVQLPTYWKSVLSGSVQLSNPTTVGIQIDKRSIQEQSIPRLLVSIPNEFRKVSLADPSSIFSWFSSWLDGPQWAREASLSRLHDHTQTHHIRQDSPGRVNGPSQRHLPDNTHKTHNRHPCRPAGFEPVIPASERQ